MGVLSRELAGDANDCVSIGSRMRLPNGSDPRVLPNPQTLTCFRQFAVTGLYPSSWQGSQNREWTQMHANRPQIEMHVMRLLASFAIYFYALSWPRRIPLVLCKERIPKELLPRLDPRTVFAKTGPSVAQHASQLATKNLFPHLFGCRECIPKVHSRELR